jgi:CRP-like cAMP-binding protein
VAIKMYHEWIKTLSSSPLFQGISPEALDAMLKCLKPKIQHCKMREIVVVYGQPFHGIGILARGKVALTRDSFSGNRIILEILDAGDIFGAMVAFSDKKVWPVSVITQEESDLLFLPANKIFGNCANICSSHSTVIKNMLNVLSNKALMLNKKIEYLSAKNLRSRLSSYLLDVYRQVETASFKIPMKRHELADFLCMPRPSLSRELGLMRDAGIIEFNGHSIKINNILKLEESVEYNFFNS